MSISEDAIVQVWSVALHTGETQVVLHFNAVHPPVVAAFMNNRLCVVAHEPHTTRSIVTMYDYANKSTIAHRAADDHETRAFTVVAAPKLRIFATATRDGVIKFWDDSNCLVGASDVDDLHSTIMYCSCAR